MLHENPAPFERFHIFCIQFKLFAVLALGLEALMPICFDPYWVVGLEDVDGVDLIGKLNREFAFSSSKGVAAADLIEASGFEILLEDLRVWGNV